MDKLWQKMDKITFFFLFIDYKCVACKCNVAIFVIFTPYFFKGNFRGGNFFSFFGYILLVKKGLITYQHIILKLQIWLQKM
jgi:hypothetical protein